MKTVFEKALQFLFILFLLTTVSCGKAEDTPIPSASLGGLYDYALEPYIKKYLTNIECLGVYSTNDTAYFSGLKNSHIWFKAIKFDKKKDISNWNTILLEFEDEEITDKHQSLQLPYGEYKNYEILKLMYSESRIVNDVSSLYTLIINGTPLYDNPPLSTNIKIILFKRNNLIKKINGPDQYIRGIRMWFGNSFFISYNNFNGGEINHVLYSENGDLLFVSNNHESSLLDSNDIISNIPVSNEQTIKIILKGDIDYTIQRLDCKENIIIWSSNLKSPFNEPSNSKYTYSLLEKTSDTWKYRVNIVYVDGTIKEYRFRVNINDGIVTLIE